MAVHRISRNVSTFCSFLFYEPISIISRQQTAAEFPPHCGLAQSAWSESNEISGRSYADTPSDGLITEKLRLYSGKNPQPTTPHHCPRLFPLCCDASWTNRPLPTFNFRLIIFICLEKNLEYITPSLVQTCKSLFRICCVPFQSFLCFTF